MRSIKVYLNDTKCERCGRVVNRKRAEIEDWIEIVYVDQTGMPVSKSVVCNGCSENWVPDAYVPEVVAAPNTATDTPAVTLSDLTASALAALGGA